MLVKDAIDRVGGQRAFDFVGPQIRRAIICEACWRAVAGQMSDVHLTPDLTRAIERTFCEVAGIWDTP